MFNTLITPQHWINRAGGTSRALFDCRFDLKNADAGLSAYRQGHIPGACYAHLETHLSGTPGPRTGRHPLPDPHVLAAQLGAWGVGGDTQVMVYDDQGGAIATRMWWLLRWLGHRQVAVLEGGWQQWTDAGYPTETTVPQPHPAHFSPRPQMDQVVGTDELQGLLQGTGFRLLDVRSGDRFRGEREPIDPVAGHVPGAVNAPFEGNLDERGNFLSPQTLRAHYQEILQGITPQQTAVMCGSGVTACHTLLAMEMAGLPGAKLYAGSWSEWIRDPARPVARCR